MRNRSDVARADLAGVLGWRRRGRAAANKEHQQIMAEIRMLQEQQPQLPAADRRDRRHAKSITTRIDDQTATTRKAFADQKLLIDGVAEGVRILREKADDTNVRLSTMTQEMQSLRQTMASMPRRPSAAHATTGDPGAGDPARRRPAPAAPVRRRRTSPPPGCSTSRPPTTRAGQYDLAIEGFQAFIRTFPTSPRADEAQLYIGYSLYNAGKNQGSARGLQEGHHRLSPERHRVDCLLQDGADLRDAQQPDNARKAFETVVKKYPSSYEAVLAKQRWSV